MNDFDNFMKHYRDILNMYNDESDKVYNKYIKALDKVNEIKDKELSNYQRDYNRIASDVEKEREEEYDRLDYKYVISKIKETKQESDKQIDAKYKSIIYMYETKIEELERDMKAEREKKVKKSYFRNFFSK